MNVKLKALTKYSVLLTALTIIHFAAEFAHFQLCGSTFVRFISSNGSPMCTGLKGISSLTMEKFLSYIT